MSDGKIESGQPPVPTFPPPVQPSPPHQPQGGVTTSRSGSIRLFQIFGITVFLHWSWFLVAMLEITTMQGRYSSLIWNTLEYLSLFCLVLLHELGHSLAARQVGGKADHILLWPLGGIAYVRLPARPGATLWGIFAGPLVNIAFLGIFYCLAYILPQAVDPTVHKDFYRYLYWITYINIALLIFNLIPVFPLDGGQIFRALLWFIMGPVQSLIIATIIGILGAIAMVLLAFYWDMSPLWICLIAGFILIHCWSGLKQALAMSQLYKMLRKVPRRQEFSCPECDEHPPVGPFWICEQCGVDFDAFETHGNCPVCHTQKPVITCISCQTQHSAEAWSKKIPADRRSY